jgi:TIR domain
MPDVFLSYSSKDRPAAERVQQALSARGIDVFWDQETPPGQDWDTWIRGKLSACKVAVVLWSRTSVKSDNVRHEALVARKAKKLLPAMIDVIEAEDLPMGLYMVQTINLVDWRSADSKGIAKLVEAIEAQLGRKPTAKAATATPASSGPSPKTQTTLALIAIAAVVAVVAWFMMQKPMDQSDAPTQQNGMTAAAPPGPACLDGSTPTDGVCANGARPIPPAPALGAGETFSTRMVGYWNWDGKPCEEGPNITLEAGRLIFTMPDSRFVHEIDTETSLETRTRVLEPAETAGHQYLLVPEFFASSETRSFNLVVDNKTTGERHTWSPCEPS